MTSITLKDHGDRLTADVEGHELVIRYGWAGDRTMRVDFVGVPSALEGRGLGTQLVGALVEKVRRDGVRLHPVCSFARTKLERHREWHDVLA